ncbi:glycosyltransferase [Clostridium oceanicum]|uniref:Glycosyltransferase n=1 Tax=Clostridium oceanicum TaxID=1543 RepID=A0ABP3V3Y2_9CLOT
MNILVLSHMYPSNFNKISGVFVHKQVKELISLGCNVKVISPIPWAGFPLNIINKKWNKYSKVPYQDVLDGVEVYYPRYIEFPRGYFFDKSGQRMYKAIKNLVYELNQKFKFDIIHSHVALPDGYCGMLLSKELNIPYVITVHGQDFQNTICKNDKLKKSVFKVLDKADKVITVSNKLKNIVSDTNFYHKIDVINNGIDIEDTMVLNNDKALEKIDVLSVSNLIKTKGIDLNIRAINVLVKKHPNIKYYIIGDGPEKEHLLEMVKKYNLLKNIIFLGQLDHKKVMEYMSKCKVFSMPSWKEGFGVVYLEAMLQGKPVIGVKGEGIEDVINNKENGILVSPNNVEELVISIEKLLDDKKYSNYVGNNAKLTVVNKFTWIRTAEKTLQIYNEII